MKKKVITALGLAVALLAVSTAAYSWNYATHAYIATKIGSVVPLIKANQIYGIMAPDLFNLNFKYLADNELRGYTHGIPKEDPMGPNQDFMQVWLGAQGILQKAVAFGYVAHNDAWGCDYVAHWKAIPTPPAFTGDYAGLPPGYIIELAVELDKVLASQKIVGSLSAWDYIGQLIGGKLPIADRINFTHNIVEFSGDILIRRADPSIGKKVAEAALLRTPEFPGLLKAVFPTAFTGLIDAAEETFRQQMVQYGGLLWSAPNEDAIYDTVSVELAQYAVEYLNAEYPSLNFKDYQSLVPIARGAMVAGVTICEKAKYMTEVNATALYVALQLTLHRVLSLLIW